MWKDLESDISGVEVTRNQLTTAQNYKTDHTQLPKYQELFLRNYSNMSSLGKYFSFGNQRVSSFAFILDGKHDRRAK